MTTTAPVIDAHGLSKRYRDHHAVRGIDLRVDHGEVVAILGPNGAGKTTTVEILEGFRRRDGGDVSVLGQDPESAGRAWRDRIGIVLQSTGEMAEATAREQVRHAARLYSTPRDPDEVITLVGLDAKADTRSRQLSGGQRRRLDVALGIIGRPDLLFLDEPTTGFDPQARRDHWDLIASLREDDVTILLTTHYLDEAAALADRVVVVADGLVVAEGPPDSIGGDQARRPIVRWREGASGQLREERTATPSAFVQALASRVAPGGGEIPGLEITRPTLEDVYLELVRSGRDDAGEHLPDSQTVHERSLA